MTKKKSIGLILAGILFSGASFNAYPLGQKSAHFQKPVPLQKPPVLRTIVLDPGHGGLDPGTLGLFSREKDVTLRITLKLGAAIKKEFPDTKIVYTRTTDVLPGNATTTKQGIYNRAQIANEAKGDLFISIHCNATDKPPGGYYEKRIIGYRKRAVYTVQGKRKKKKILETPVYKSYWVKNMTIGATTYIWKADRSDKKGDAIDQRGENSKEMEDSTEVWDTEGPEARIRAELYEKKYFNNSALLASLVEEAFAKAGRKTWGVRQRGVGISVLESTGMPSVLIETGYLSNTEEEHYLNSDRGQREIVRNILGALKRYKQELGGK